jgi:hypothetical protein
MKKWIKIVSVLAVVALGLSVVAGVVLAQGPVDEDSDGVCDVCGQASGEGVMRGWQLNQGSDVSGSGAGWRANGEQPCDDFVDEDGDGICDLCGAEMRGPRYNQDGEQWQPRGPQDGQVCDDFVDEDGDGVCDNHDEVESRQTGRGGRGGAGGGMRRNVQNEL